MSSEEKKIVRKSLVEVGQVLPVGIFSGDTLSKNFDTRAWKMKHERELGKLRDQKRRENVATFVSIVLSTLCTKVGPHDFDAMKPEERRLIVGQMFMPDVYFIYIWLRINSLGADLECKITCPSCEKRFDFIADLNSVEVGVVENLEDSKWSYKLRDPFEVRKTLVEEILFGPARWNVLETVQSGALNTGEAKAAIIRSSIHAIAGLDNVLLAEHELDEMTKRDLEAISAGLSDNFCGPDMSIEGACPGCASQFQVTMDWGYDNFFATSSR